MSSFPIDQASGCSSTALHIEAFRQTPINQWQGEECEEWAKSVLSHYGVDPMSVDLWSFRTKSGQELLQFTSLDFSHLAGHQHGNTFYQAFRQLSSKDTQQNLSRSRQQIESIFLEELGEERYEYEPLTEEEIQELNLYILDESRPPVKSDTLRDVGTYDIQLNNPLVQELEHLEREEDLVQIPAGGFLDDDEEETDAGEEGAALSIPSEVMLSKIQSKNQKRSRGPKNWEFLMRLLVDPRTNPSIIEWEDEASATFRLKQPAVIVRFWASRNPDQSDLSYNNFARGLRHHYKTGTLQPIKERQFVYRCGPKALEFLKEIKNISSWRQEQHMEEAKKKKKEIPGTRQDSPTETTGRELIEKATTSSTITSLATTSSATTSSAKESSSKRTKREKRKTKKKSRDKVQEKETKILKLRRSKRMKNEKN